MGCCYSSEKPTVYEVTIDNQGIARHVPEGQGTHLIRVSEANETILEEKPTSIITTPNPTFQRPMTTNAKRVHPLTTGTYEKKDPETNKA
ncbi:hypothetical protein BC940DRAFT_310579 [Gongronella butleri]|nr:hypothetical protein BC940DRAFT_310579 [Gongronella butleri]